MEAADSVRRTLKDRIRNLKLENHQDDPRFYESQEENTEGDSFRGRSRRSSCRPNRLTKSDSTGKLSQTDLIGIEILA